MEHVHEYNAVVTKLKMILDGEQLPILNHERTENVIQNKGEKIFFIYYMMIYVLMWHGLWSFQVGFEKVMRSLHLLDILDLSNPCLILYCPPVDL